MRMRSSARVHGGEPWLGVSQRPMLCHPATPLPLLPRFCSLGNLGGLLKATAWQAAAGRGGGGASHACVCLHASAMRCACMHAARTLLPVFMAIVLLPCHPLPHRALPPCRLAAVGMKPVYVYKIVGKQFYEEYRVWIVSFTKVNRGGVMWRRHERLALRWRVCVWARISGCPAAL